MLLCLAFLVLLAPLVAKAADTGEKEPGIIEIVAGDTENLFKQMTTMMPGQSVSDYFTVKNASKKGTVCDFYLYATLAGEKEFGDNLTLKANSEKLLEALNLKVVLHNASGRESIQGPGTVVYDGKSDYSTPGMGLTRGNRILLGTLRPSQAVTIEIIVSVPEDLGNEYEGLQGKFWWNFDAETEGVIPPPSSSSAPPESRPLPPVPSSSLPPFSSGSSAASASSTTPSSTTPSGGSGVAPPASSPGRGPSASVEVSSSGGGMPAATISDGGPTGNIFQDLIDQQIPFGNLASSGTWSLLNLIFALLAFFIAVFLILTLLVNRGKETKWEAEQALETEENGGKQLAERAKAGNGDFSVEKEKRLAVMKISSAIVGLFTGFLFILLENLQLSVSFINRWTPLIGAVFLVHLLLAILQLLVKKKYYQEDNAYASGSVDETEEESN